MASRKPPKLKKTRNEITEWLLSQEGFTGSRRARRELGNKLFDEYMKEKETEKDSAEETVVIAHSLEE